MICLILLVLLIGFFMIGYLSETTIRRDVEFYTSEAFNTLVRIGDMQMSVYPSTISASEIEVIDPENKSRAVFSAKSINLVADIARFLEQRVVLRELQLQDVYLRLLQTKNGRFDFLSDHAVAMAEYEPTLVRVGKVFSWTADQVNPMHIIPNTPPVTPPPLPQDARADQDEANRLEQLPPLINVKTQELVRGFRLKLPRDYPDFLVKDLCFNNVAIELCPYRERRGLLLHDLSGRAVELSSRPTKHPKPITALVSGYAGPGSSAWITVSTRLDFFAGRTNINVDFVVSNIQLLAVLPLVKLYTPLVEMLNIQSGNLTAYGRIRFINGALEPSGLYCKLERFTGNVRNVPKKYEWLRMLTISNALVEMTVPLDNTPPYFHLETAFAKQKFRTEIHDFKFEFRAKDIGKDVLDGYIERER